MQDLQDASSAAAQSGPSEVLEALSASRAQMLSSLAQARYDGAERVRFAARNALAALECLNIITRHSPRSKK